MPKDITLPYVPQPKQQILHTVVARQIFYGGAAGGGKSTCIRWDAIRFCLENPGCQAYLFRRTIEELRDNHIKFIKNEIPPEIGQYNETRNSIEFFNKSALHFCYCEKEADVTRHQGKEMHWVGIDEASHLTDFQINYLKTRNRLGSWVPSVDKERLPRFVMASNPGGVGHQYLKTIFLDQAPPETVFFDPSMRNPKDPKDRGWSSIFIPAKMRDNKFIDANYEASFSGLPPEYARALREGDWDAVVGQALHTLNRERHMLRPFVPPKWWTKFMVIDWGTASPFAIGWFCVSEGAELKANEGWPARWLPAGAVVMYREWYGWNGRPNQGLRLPPQEVAKGILKREREASETMDYRVGDTEMWAQKSGPAVQEWFMEVDPRLVMRKSEKDRKRNYQEILARLAGNERYMENGKVETDPMFFATANCTNFWRTVPSLTLDDVDPEKGPDTDQEDHLYDVVSYGCRSRPYVTTEKDRYWAEFGEEIERARGTVDDPYHTSA